MGPSQGFVRDGSPERAAPDAAVGRIQCCSFSPRPKRRGLQMRLEGLPVAREADLWATFGRRVEVGWELGIGIGMGMGMGMGG